MRWGAYAIMLGLMAVMGLLAFRAIGSLQENFPKTLKAKAAYEQLFERNGR